MKKGYTIALLLVASLFLNDLRAQSAEDDIQIIQGAWGKQKRELVRIGMELSMADSLKFWPIYDKYEVARKKIGKERLLILSDYANSYDTLTSAKADALVNRLFKNDAANNQLLQVYYNQFKKSMNALQAAKFLHIESFLQSYIKANLQGNLPFIGDLEMMKSN